MLLNFKETHSEGDFRTSEDLGDVSLLEEMY